MQYIALLLVLLPQDIEAVIPRPSDVTLEDKNTTLLQAVRSIRRQTGYNVMVDLSLGRERLQQVSVQKATLWETMAALVEGRPELSIHHIGNDVIQIARLHSPQAVQAKGPLLLTVSRKLNGQLEAFFHVEPSHKNAVGIDLNVLEARDGSNAPIENWVGRKPFQRLSPDGLRGLPSPRLSFDPSPTTLSRLRIKASLYYPTRWAERAVRPSLKKQSIELEGITLTYWIQFSERRLPTLHITANKVLEKAPDQHLMSLLRTLQVRTLDSTGETLPVSRRGRAIDAEKVSSFEYWSVIEDAGRKRSIGLRDIASTELELVATQVSRSYVFDLKDVRLERK